MGGCKREGKRAAAVEVGEKVYARRKETVERSFADAKQHHGHRYARFRGLSKVQMQCLQYEEDGTAGASLRVFSGNKPRNPALERL